MITISQYQYRVMGSETNISLEATLNTLNNTINNTINDYTAGFKEEGKSCIQDGIIEVGHAHIWCVT